MTVLDEPSHRPTPARMPTAQHASDPLTILLADDHETMRTLWRDMLSERLPGVRLIEAQNGAHCLWMVYETRPDLILLDLNMPVMNGFEVARSLKQNVGTRIVPVIVITGGDYSVDEIDALGCEGYVRKPFTPEQLVNEIVRVVRRRVAGPEPAQD